MPSVLDRLRAAFVSRFPNWRKGAELSGPLLAILLGLALGVASFTSEQSTVYARTYSGALDPGNLTLNLPLSQVTYVEVNMSEGGCSLRLYPATQVGSLLFNDTGELPAQWISCTNRTATGSFNVTNLILVNNGPTATPYAVSAQGILVQTPWDWLALPGMGLALAGLLVFVPRIVLHEALRYRERYDWRGKKK